MITEQRTDTHGRFLSPVEASSPTAFSPLLSSSPLATAPSSPSFSSRTNYIPNCSSETYLPGSCYPRSQPNDHLQHVLSPNSPENAHLKPSLQTTNRTVRNIATVIDPSQIQRSSSVTSQPSSTSTSVQQAAVARTTHHSRFFDNHNPTYDLQYLSHLPVSSSVPFTNPSYVQTRNTFSSQDTSNRYKIDSTINHSLLGRCNGHLGSDLQDIHISPLDPATDINNNCSASTPQELAYLDRHSLYSNGGGNRGVCGGSSLPPFSTLVGDTSPKQELNSFMLCSLPSRMDEDTLDEGMVGGYPSSRTSSCSTMEDEEPKYTDLISVHQQYDECCFMDGYLNPGVLIRDEHILSPIKTEPGDPSFFDPEFEEYPTTPQETLTYSPRQDSDYDSSAEFRDQYFPGIAVNPSINEVQPPPRSRPNGYPHYNQPYSGQGSPNSDEGFSEMLWDGTNMPEENLPDFDKIQHLPTEPAGQVQRRRISTSNPKEKKKAARDSPSAIEKERRKPGRKPGQVSNVLHLWEFMRDLLHSPENRGIIEWISRPEGVFRVVNSTEVARLWGEKKKNKKKMTYEKLSRSLRYSRLEGYFSDLPKDKNYPKKLCFKFGPKSKDWH